MDPVSGDRAVVSELVVLGATGSIGTQTLEVARWLDLPVVSVASRSPSRALLKIADEWPDASVAIVEPGPARSDIAAKLGARVAFGEEAVRVLAMRPGSTVVNGIVGVAGLAPSVAALEAGNRLALANKESLVAGGPILLTALADGGGELIPIDSEHSAIWQMLVGEDRSRVRRIVLTASGGPFRACTAEELKCVTPEEALDHPTWSMGPRVTVDSATLMNKAFEVIEAHYLFGVPYDAIDVVVHPQSVVHSMVEFVDGAVTAELGEPDMRIPIQYAITYPERHPAPGPSLQFDGVGLTFEEPSAVTLHALRLGYEAGRAGGSVPAVLNAADEVGVAAFLEHRIDFLDIVDVVASTLDAVPRTDLVTLDDVFTADEEARRVAVEVIGSR